MDKRVIFAVAGSGKTWTIKEKLTLDKRFLIITYTNNNVNTLRNEIIRKFGYFPENVKLFSYFTFLYSFCFKPFLSDKLKQKGINWKPIPESKRFVSSTKSEFYFDSYRQLYHNRISKLCDVMKILSHINARIENYFDCLYIDEIQDFAGHDFDFLKSLTKVNCDILFVGDFYQHTFDTSRDGAVNKNLFEKGIDAYKEKIEQMGLFVDTKTLLKSRRCSKTICDFIKTNLNIDIEAYDNRNSEIKYIYKQEEINKIIQDNNIIKLFLKEHHKYNCRSKNWGECKGEEFDNVCVVLNKTTKEKYVDQQLDLFDNHRVGLKSLAPETKNKFYVACSRARNNLYFISDEFVK